MAEHKTVWEGKYLRIKVCGTWEYAERPNALAGVVIVAVTNQGELLMTEQHRVPMGRNVIELPAGLSGDDEYSGEELIQTARRELLEETGYEAGKWVQLTELGPPSAGLSNEMVVFFHASQLTKIGAGGGEAREEITVHQVPLREIEGWLQQKHQEGFLIDPKIFAGLYFAEKSND